MKTVLLDFTAVGSRAEIHALLKEKLALPPYYGNNLDALHDCLTDVREDTVIQISRVSDGSPTGSYLEKMQRVFLDAERENPHLSVYVLTTFPR